MSRDMSVESRAIETEYRGFRFRSRLEARWAVFFDGAGVAWDYEPQGFELPNGRYLPDFRLTESRTWFEAKGQEPSDREVALALDLFHATGERVIVSQGRIPDGWGERFAEGDYRIPIIGIIANDTIESEPLNARMATVFRCCDHARVASLQDRDWRCTKCDRLTVPFADPVLARALRRARGARFEFGESGQ